MQTKDWPVVIEARKAAEKQLEFYCRMMDKKSLTVTKPLVSPPRLLTDTTEGIHPDFIRNYFKRYVHDRMLPIYFAYDPDHKCELC